jgi:hypothetical protein
MSARAILVRGLLAGLIAGLATFFVAHQVGEPHVETAIALEEATAHDHAHSHDSEEGTEVSRTDQRTWGLLTGSLAVGVALGGIVALVAAGTVGRMGPLLPGQSTALVSFLGFVSVALVPFLKYPATPPGVGSGDTIGDRTALYFGFLLVSVAAVVLSTYATLRLRRRVGTYAAVVAGAAGFLVVVVIAGQVFATVDEVGDFPADTLWNFRVASLITLATTWGVIGVVLTGLVSRLYARDVAEAERRELAASI